ncbi:MAG: hypothetical protein JRJ60_13540 [Deltaproteobacteria bacterium]|nr:hypothetical protein [Deltaproteobacteria bacterium]
MEAETHAVGWKVSKFLQLNQKAPYLSRARIPRFGQYAEYCPLQFFVQIKKTDNSGHIFFQSERIILPNAKKGGRKK